MLWSYGVTTVPQRTHTTLPRTLKSLAVAGFPDPRLFIDGGSIGASMITVRTPAVRAFGNWVLALWELYIREPMADRYAIFQDDLLTYQNLRQYLERCEYPKHGYWNLYTIPASNLPGVRGWVPSPLQDGKGALGLVFDRDALCTLLSSKDLVQRPQCLERGHKSIDGGVLTAMANAGYTEYIHQPTLLMHTGVYDSVIGNSIKAPPDTFLGEDYDALELRCAKTVG